MQRQEPGPDSVHPERAQSPQNQSAVPGCAGDTGQTTGHGQDHSFDQEQPDDPPSRKTHRPQSSNLPQPLLDSETEEQACKNQRRDDQEEAEIGEVFAEISRPLSGLKTLGSNR